MRKFIRSTIFHPALSLISPVLWGLLEFIALQRLRLGDPSAWDKRRAR